MVVNLGRVLAGDWQYAADDIRAVAHPVLRHRVITNYSAESNGITPDKVVDRLLEELPETRPDDEIPRQLQRAIK